MANIALASFRRLTGEKQDDMQNTNPASAATFFEAKETCSVLTLMLILKFHVKHDSKKRSKNRFKVEKSAELMLNRCGKENQFKSPPKSPPHVLQGHLKVLRVSMH